MSALGLPRAYWGLVVCSAGLFVSIGMANILVPTTVVDRYGQDVGHVGIIVSAFLGASIVCRPLAAKIMTVIGPRLLLVAATAVYALALCAMASTSTPLLGSAARGAAGAAQGAAYLVTLTSVMRAAPVHLVARALSMSSLVVFVGLAAGPVLAEWLLGMTTLTVCWLLAAVVPMVVLPFGLRAAPPSEHEHAGPDADHHGSDSAIPPSARLTPMVAPMLLLALGSVAYGCFQTLVPLAVLGSGASAGVAFAIVSIAVLLTQVLVVGWGHAVGPTARATISIALGVSAMIVLGTLEGPARFAVAAAMLGGGTALLFPAVMHGTVGHLRGRARTRALAVLSPGFEVGQIGGASLGAAVAGGIGFRVAFIACAAMGSLALFFVPALRQRGAGPSSR